MITFQFVDTALPRLDKELAKQWIRNIIACHGKTLGQICYVFCSDEHLLSINRAFLNHDFYTDIITFPTNESDRIISGELYISTDRIADNATQLGRPFEEEMYRVIIHGVLHLIGFKDKTEEDAAEMRRRENESLVILNNLISNN